MAERASHWRLEHWEVTSREVGTVYIVVLPYIIHSMHLVINIHLTLLQLRLRVGGGPVGGGDPLPQGDYRPPGGGVVGTTYKGHLLLPPTYPA